MSTKLRELEVGDCFRFRDGGPVYTVLRGERHGRFVRYSEPGGKEVTIASGTPVIADEDSARQAALTDAMMYLRQALNLTADRETAGPIEDAIEATSKALQSKRRP